MDAHHAQHVVEAQLLLARMESRATELRERREEIDVMRDEVLALIAEYRAMTGLQRWYMSARFGLISFVLGVVFGTVLIYALT